MTAGQVLKINTIKTNGPYREIWGEAGNQQATGATQVCTFDDYAGGNAAQLCSFDEYAGKCHQEQIEKKRTDEEEENERDRPKKKEDENIRMSNRRRKIPTGKTAHSC